MNIFLSFKAIKYKIIAHPCFPLLFMSIFNSYEALSGKIQRKHAQETEPTFMNL